ncbi:MAG TPA: hypothetical protein ENI92_03520, partial [Bacteroidetes bacterium]|nr:hypothetical protein [Bacteroidota bacterium]
MSYPVDPSGYCAFSADWPEDDWISAVRVVNQRAEVLLDVSWGSYAPTGYRDATAHIIEAAPGDVLTISVTVEAGSSSWDQFLSWGHAIDLPELTKVADLYGGAGCPWTHTFDWTVPAGSGAYLISLWEHYGDYGEGCGVTEYGERVDLTLFLPETVPPAVGVGNAHAPTGIAAYPAAVTVPRVVQRIYAVILSADGLEDFEVPASLITLRLRDTDASYVSAVIPDPTRWTDEIMARKDGTMHIWSGVIDEAGARTLMAEMIYCNVQNFYFNLGAGNVLTIAGTRYRTNSAPTVRRLDHVSHVERDEAGRYTVTAALDPGLLPGDTAMIEGAGILADLVRVTIRHNHAEMTVEGE